MNETTGQEYYNGKGVNVKPRAGHPAFYEMTREEEQLHAAKNKDYAQGGDPLGNFKRVGKILGQYPRLDTSDPVVVALVYSMKQLDAALWMLANSYDGAVESIDARLQDVGVYCKLARILRREQIAGPPCCKVGIDKPPEPGV